MKTGLRESRSDMYVCVYVSEWWLDFLTTFIKTCLPCVALYIRVGQYVKTIQQATLSPSIGNCWYICTGVCVSLCSSASRDEVDLYFQVSFFLNVFNLETALCTHQISWNTSRTLTKKYYLYSSQSLKQELGVHQPCNLLRLISQVAWPIKKFIRTSLFLVRPEYLGRSMWSPSENPTSLFPQIAESKDKKISKQWHSTYTWCTDSGMFQNTQPSPPNYNPL